MVAVPLSDQDWSRISHLFTDDKVPRFGRPRRAARGVLDAVLWVIVNGEKWHHLSPSLSTPANVLHEVSELEELGHHGRGAQDARDNGPT